MFGSRVYHPRDSYFAGQAGKQSAVGLILHWNAELSSLPEIHLIPSQAEELEVESQVQETMLHQYVCVSMYSCMHAARHLCSTMDSPSSSFSLIYSLCSPFLVSLSRLKSYLFSGTEMH